MDRTLLFSLVVLTGCGLDGAGQLHATADGGGIDATTDDVTVLPIDAASDVPPPPLPDAASCLDTGPCTATVPKDWTLVVVPPDANQACPSSYVAHDAVTAIVPKAGACDCSCTITQDPVCDKGQVTFYYSNDTTCTPAGVAPTFPGCKDVGFFNITLYQKAQKLPPTDGVCKAAVKEDRTLVDKTARRSCDVAAKCAEDVCRDGLAGWGTCIAKNADEACPAGWGTKREVVGTDYDLGCSACPTCDANGPSTCGAASVKMYLDSNCATTATASFPADGQCDQVTGGGAGVRYAKYFPGALTKACIGSGAKTAAPTLKGKSTICCK